MPYRDTSSMIVEAVGDEVEVEPASVAARPVPRGYRTDLGEAHCPRVLLQADHNLEQPLPAEFLAEPSEFEQELGAPPASPAPHHLLRHRSASLVLLPPFLQGRAGNVRLHDGRRDLRGVLPQDAALEGPTEKISEDGIPEKLDMLEVALEHPLEFEGRKDLVPLLRRGPHQRERTLERVDGEMVADDPLQEPDGPGPAPGGRGGGLG